MLCMQLQGHMHLNTQDTCTHTHIHTHARTHTHAHTRTHTRMYERTQAHTNASTPPLSLPLREGVLGACTEAEDLCEGKAPSELLVEEGAVPGREVTCCACMGATPVASLVHAWGALD